MILPLSFSQKLRAVFPITLPVMTGYLCLGFAFGVLMRTHGFSPIWAAAMSLIVFAGSMEFVGITLLVSPFAPLSAFFLSVLVDARHLFYGLSLLKEYGGTGRRKALLVSLLSDETFSIVTSVPPPIGVPARDFYLMVSVLDYSYWQAGTLLGALLGGDLPFNTQGLDFALTALFVVLLIEQLKERAKRPAGAVGLICALLALALFGGNNMVVASMVLILAALILGRKVFER